MQIYLARNNQQAGPYSLEQLNQMLSSQQVLLTDLVWHEGMSEWKTLGELTQGKLVYEPIGYSPFNSQIKSRLSSSMKVNMLNYSRFRNNYKLLKSHQAKLLNYNSNSCNLFPMKHG